MSTQLESSEAAILSRVIQPDSGDWPQAAAEAILRIRSEEHTSELQSRSDLVCRLLLEKKKKKRTRHIRWRQLKGRTTRTRGNVGGGHVDGRSTEQHLRRQPLELSACTTLRPHRPRCTL